MNIVLEINRFLIYSPLPPALRRFEKQMLENYDSEEHILEDLFHVMLVIEVFCVHSGLISQDPGSAVSAA